MARLPSPPSYPKKPHKGQVRITVRLASGGRQDIVLGPFRSPESRVEYARILAELEANLWPFSRLGESDQPLNCAKVTRT
jgi:hypothetical protein